MSWIGDLIKGGAAGVIGGVGGIIDNLNTSQDEKNQAKLEAERILMQRDMQIEQTIRTELAAKERILVAELNQGDAFTKRARPAVVYFGLLMIFWNYGLAPALQVPRLDLPTEFWVAWGGIVSTWVVGRSAEKRGSKAKAVSMIVGD